jgi:O-antigen/teichoic acid export membrane protein
LMGYLDVVLVKHYFDPLDAGLYASASLVAKILLYVVSFVPAVLIPQATDRHTRGERTRYVLWAAFGFVALVVVVGLIAYAFEGRSLLHAFVGQKYDAADGILAVYAVAMAALALTNTFASYALATHRLAFVWPLFATTIATIAAIVVVHPSLYAVALDMAVGNFAMLLAAAVPLAVQSRVRSPSSRTS